MSEETENKIVESTTEKNVKPGSPTETHSRPGKLYLVAFILLVILFSLVVFVGNKRIATLEQHIDQVDVTSGGAIKNIEARLNGSLSGITETRKKLDELESKQDVLENLIPEPVKQQINDNEEFALAEIEHLLIIASYRLQLNHDVATTLAAMEAADTRLKGLRDPNLLVVREQLIADMNELRSLNQADLSGLGLFLSDLINRVDSLPLKNDVLIQPTQTKTESDSKQEQEKSVKQFFKLVWQELRSLVVITRDENVGKARLLPDEIYFLRANIKLELANARFAVFNRDTNNFRASIDHIQSWLNDYFDLSNAKVRNIYDSLKRMNKLELKFPKVDISSSLESVRAVIRNRSEETNHINEEEKAPVQ